MPQKPLPKNPDLEHFRHQARDLQKAHRAADPAANQRIREFHPRLHRASEEAIREARFTLADAQLTLAREYGFPSWPKLKLTMETREFVDPQTPYHERIEDAAFRRAVDLLDAGDVEGLRSQLLAHPSLAKRKVHFAGGGYFADATLLNFVAENPIRRRRLPLNIVAVAGVLVEAGADPDDGTVGLVASGCVARECGLQVPLIDFLCGRGADPGKAMEAALGHGEFAAVEALLRHGAPVDLPAAAALGRLQDAQRLLPTANGDQRHRALALAAQHGRLGVARLLLDAGEDPNRYNPLGCHAHSGPLHQAACYGHLEVVRLLVERGARLDLRDTIYQGTPAEWAFHCGQPEVAAYFAGLE